jgi:pyruvate dehydrogenase E2 component (dihydrolipoamide acetyltransferase)
MSALKEAKVPDIGGSKNVPIIEMLIKVGDVVKKDQGLITLESDKATMEVPAPFAGTVRELKVKLGDEISEGDTVAIIEAADPSDASTPPVISEVATPEKVESAPTTQVNVVQAPIAAPVATPISAPVVAAASNSVRTPPVSFDAEALMPGTVPYASPAVRVFARELGLDLVKVKGSERGGRITKADVQQFVKSALASGATTSNSGSGLNLIPWPQVDFAKYGAIESQPLSRIKKISGANLARNWAMIPHVTQNDEADITEMDLFRKKLAEEHKDVKVTPLVFMMKAVVAALKKYPNFNASLDGDNLILKKYFHIGIAVDTPDGLMVPVIRDVDKKGLLELAQELAVISAKARDKKLGPNDMQGGCFSISSLGGIGGIGFTPIINAPEVAILGVSKSQIKPVWNGTEFMPRLMLPLSLSYDHRVIDGAAAARFASFLSLALADLRQLLL